MVQNCLFLIIFCCSHVLFLHTLFFVIRNWCVYMTQTIIPWSVNNSDSECLCSRPGTVTLCHYSSPLKGSAITTDLSSWSCQGINENRFWQYWHQAAKIILWCCCLGRSLFDSPAEVNCNNVMSMGKPKYSKCIPDHQWSLLDLLWNPNYDVVPEIFRYFWLKVSTAILNNAIWASLYQLW